MTETARLQARPQEAGCLHLEFRGARAPSVAGTLPAYVGAALGDQI
jgi:hypothetical protein